MKFFWLLLFVSSFAYGETVLPFNESGRKTAPEGLKAFSTYAIQANGRLKPFDTFAREGMELLTGSAHFEGQDPVAMTLSLIFEPQKWETVPFFRITHLKLKRDLGLAEGQKFFSPKEISASPQLTSLFTELEDKTKSQEKLDPYWQAVQQLGQQLSFVHTLVSGQSLRLVPPTPEVFRTKTDAWTSLDQLNEEMKLRFTLIAATFVSSDPEVQKRFPVHVQTFAEMSKQTNPELYPSEFRLKSEIAFNRIRPFFKACLLAFFAVLCLSLSFWWPSRGFVTAGYLFYGLSLLLQVYGFATRCWLAGRPPVSNMYESIIWVAFGSMFFGAVFEIIHRRRITAVGAAIFGTIGLLIADNTGLVVSSSIQPLEPVLRSNLWLTIHVLTIAASYAAFSVSLVLGNIGLGQYVIWGRESKNLPLRELAMHAYRTIQVGVVLLAAGTILGGVWADYSWGRFWGWDPKETWALIALLGYLALLHARFRGMVRSFGFLVGCVLAFMGVVMAWYGVNFVLGAGLHSYGFGSGGITYVATYVSVQVFFVLYARYFYLKAQASSRPSDMQAAQV